MVLHVGIRKFCSFVFYTTVTHTKFFGRNPINDKKSVLFGDGV